MQRDKTALFLTIAAAYLFGIALRMIWVYQMHDIPEFFFNGQLMINTNDGYYFGAGAQKALWGMHAPNPRVPDVWAYGTVALTTLLVKLTPLSLETVMLYLPAFVSSLVVVPIILIGRLLGRPLWGFFSALLAVVGWSYYNRTMTGYYDTDMFSVMSAVFILYFLIKSSREQTLKAAWFAALFIAIYPFLYDAGKTVVYAMGSLYGLFMAWYHRRETVAWQSIVLVFAALVPVPLTPPYNYLLSLAIVTALYMFFRQREPQRKYLIVAAAALMLGYLTFGHVFTMILERITQYVHRGTVGEGLHYYSVFQTIREAGHIPFETFANRIAGSVAGLAAAAVGYLLLLLRYRVMLLSLPLVAIGVFALWGGLRFTVYAVPIAAMGAVYLFATAAETLRLSRRMQIALMALGTAALLVPNIEHIVKYRVPTVLKADEVRDLVKLNEIADSKDYTIAWWDYGYPIWFYSDTNTLIDGGKHQNDNFIVSTILQTDSPALAANLARLAVETYVTNGHTIVADTLFGKGKDRRDPNAVLTRLAQNDYPLPPKSREVYLYLPYRMLDIFPTVTLFGNIDLLTGEPLRKSVLLSLFPVGQRDTTVHFANGMSLDYREGILYSRKKEPLPLSRFVVTALQQNGKIATQTQSYGREGLVAVFMQSYGRFVIMDPQTARSIYIRMFLFGEYDPRYFEPVIVTPLTRIYRVKS